MSLVDCPVPVTTLVSFSCPFFHTLPQMKQSLLILNAEAIALPERAPVVDDEELVGWDRESSQSRFAGICFRFDLLTYDERHDLW